MVWLPPRRFGRTRIPDRGRSEDPRRNAKNAYLRATSTSRLRLEAETTGRNHENKRGLSGMTLPAGPDPLPNPTKQV